MKIRTIELKNFKSHIHTKIHPELITILIGPNSSGKSSILQSLMVLKSSLRPEGAPKEPPITKTKSFDLGNFVDVVTNGVEESTFSIRLEGTRELKKFKTDVKSPSPYSYLVEFSKNGKKGVSLNCEVENIEVKFGWISSGSSRGKITHLPSRKVYELNQLELTGINPKIRLIPGDQSLKDVISWYFLNGGYTQTLLDELYYVPFNRTTTSYGVSLISNYGDFTSTNLQEMMSSMISLLSKDPKLLDKVSEFIKEISGKSIRTRNLDMDGRNQGVTIDFVNQGTSNAIANEGTGLNQLVLLLVTLVMAPKDAIITIDEPEIHLHPRAQSKLAKIILDIAKNEKKQIIFTTHSEHMIYPFLASVANKKDNSLSSKDLAVYYLNLDENNNLTKSEHLEVNDKGQLDGGLKGFWDVDLETLSEFLGPQNE